MHRTCIQLISKSIQCTRNKSRFPEKKTPIFNSVFPSENLPCGFQDVKFVSDKKQQILQGKNTFTIGHTLPPFYKKKLNPRHIGRDLHNLRSYHYKHNKRSISLSPTTVIVRKKDIAFFAYKAPLMANVLVIN